jgi:hypothetical protein
MIARLLGRNADTARTETLRTTPWAWRDEEGLYIGWNRQGWLYREFPLNPLTWEDPATQLRLGTQMATMLYDLADTSRDRAGGLSMLAERREFHLVTVTWSVPGVPPEGTPAPLAAYIQESLDMMAASPGDRTVTRKALFVGVRLRSSAVDSLQSVAQQAGQAQGGKGRSRAVLTGLRETLTTLLGEEVPDLSVFDTDRDAVTPILDRAGCVPPSPAALDQLEAWFNGGLGPDLTLLESKDVLALDNGDRIEMASVMRFDNPVLSSPGATWLLDAMTYSDSPAAVVSVRGMLEPATIARARARSNQRRIISQVQEEAETGDLGRVENTTTFQLANQLETLFAQGEPLISRCSIVFGRRTRPGAESYIDELRTRHGIRVRALEHRQLAALDETLPCSDKRVNPFLQDVTIPMLAYAGMQGFSELGDPTGVLVGLTAPDWTPCYLNPLGAPAADRPPAMLIAGDPGSGKTFAAQNMATQCVLAGLNTWFINPKGMDSLAPFAEFVGGQVVRLTAVEGKGGFFDPFRFCPDPQVAAKIATDFILDVLGSKGVGTGFSPEKEITLGAGMQEGATAGARCVADCLKYVPDTEVLELIRRQAIADPTFSLGISSTPVDRFEVTRGLTLIEFDRQMDFPEPGTPPSQFSRSERITLAITRLVTRVSLEALAATRGGAMFVDEAWTFLSSTEGLATLQRLGRLGRSQNLLPVFITQRVADIVKEGVDMEGYLSRVFVMKLNDPREASAALRLCGLDDTQARIDWLRDAGPRRGRDGMNARPALALHRDLHGRHSAVLLGPVPPEAATAFTTNPEDRRRREAARESQSG